MKQLQGKRALVTGAASGIGRAIALELARQGTHLLVADRDQMGMAHTAEMLRELGVEVETFHYDAEQPQEIVELAQFAAALPDGIDILVNNAGITYRGPTDRMEPEHWERMLDVNLYAPIRLTHELMPTLFVRRDVHILNVCSVLGLVGLPKVCAYSTSKFGLVGFTESLRSEYGVQGIGVTAICPGLVRTNLFNASISNGHERQKDPPRWATTTPERVAKVAVKAIRKNRARVVMEPVGRLMCFSRRFMPGLLDFALHLGRRKMTERRLAYWQSYQVEHAAKPKIVHKHDSTTIRRVA
ncbi:SDR family NAD(P)-dependent oxidoreductase [Aeoliella sp.]|uniref:SDR family NAD(P)-dependent oxidoreductase n=1 Tax=Aeoliella sp. TaxID=2795800 RepID=UPI003CCC34B0